VSLRLPRWNRCFVDSILFPCIKAQGQVETLTLSFNLWWYAVQPMGLAVSAHHKQISMSKMEIDAMTWGICTTGLGSSQRETPSSPNRQRSYNRIWSQAKMAKVCMPSDAHCVVDVLIDPKTIEWCFTCCLNVCHERSHPGLENPCFGVTLAANLLVSLPKIFAVASHTSPGLDIFADSAWLRKLVRRIFQRQHL
jgi:hypothetical protein